MNILRFEMNVPKQVALETPEGIVVEGRYGDRIMYRLVDGRVMYVPPIIRARIEAQGITPGELFELCKTQVRDGQRRLIEWRLNRIQTEDGHNVSESISANPDPGPPETQLEAGLRASLECVQEQRANPNNPVATCDPVSRPNPPNETTRPENGAPLEQNGHGPHPVAAPKHHNGHVPERTLERIEDERTTPTTKLEHALKTAISAAHNAEKFGTELGYVVRFDADAIKSMAITVLINMTQGVRR